MIIWAKESVTGIPFWYGDDPKNLKGGFIQVNKEYEVNEKTVRLMIEIAIARMEEDG